MRRLESIGTQLLEVGVTPMQITSLFRADDCSLDEYLGADSLEHKLRLMGVSELMLTSNDIAEVVTELDIDGDELVSCCELNWFLIRGHKTLPEAIQAIQAFEADQGRLAMGGRVITFLDAPYYISSVILNIKYNKARLNDSTAHG